MAIGGVEYEQALGMMTAITEIQRSGAKAARGLVSIQSRYNQILDESASTGKKLIAFYDEHNIQLYDQEGQLRSLWETLSDVAEIWDTLDENEQKYFLNIQAGANQSIQLGALMENFQTAVEATETALNSSGSALQENEAYMQSLQSKTTLLSATFQTLANDVIPKDLIANGLDLLNKALELLDSDLGIILTRLTLLTGIGWGMTSLVNASKVLPAVVGQIGNFAKLLSGATIVIPKAAAEVGGLTASLATLQAVALPVVAIISALGVAIYAIVEKARKNKQAIDEMSSSAIQFKESIDNLNKSATEEKAKIEATVSSVDIYIKRIEELDKKSHLNNTEQAEYHALLQKIVDIMPSVASSIDLQNDKIIGGTAAIYNQIEAWKALAQQQAYQTQMTDLYKTKADIEFQLAEQRTKLLELQSQDTTSVPDVAVYSIFTRWFNKKEKERLKLTNEISNTEKAISALEAQLNEADSKIESASKTLLNIYGIESTNISNATDEQEDVWNFILNKEDTTLDTLRKIKEEYRKAKQESKKLTEEEEQRYYYVQKVIEEIKFSIDEYTSSFEKYITLLTSEYNLLELQSASQDELTAKIKEIQNARHEEAEILREVLENADVLELTQEDIYEINTKINECSIDWWNWQNRIKTDVEEIKEEYEDISDVLEELFALEKEELNAQKDAINTLASEMGYYYDDQIDKINQEIDSLKEANEEVENQITLQKKLDALAKAKQQKVLVYKNGRFQYINDIDAVSSAKEDLATYKRQQELQKQISGLEAEKDALNKLKQSWSNMVSDYEREQNRWLISQRLGINTALDGWQRLVSGAEVYAEQYRQIMSNLSEIEVAENKLHQTTTSGSLSSKTVNYDPNIDYHALMLQATTAAELSHWAELREAKIKGENIIPDKSTADIIRDWYKTHSSYAMGTLSANGGLSLVGERGAELRVLNNGDGIIPSNMTTNLMAWGSMTPHQFKMQSLGNFGKSMQVTIQALNLPNVSDGIGFVDYVRNNMFGQVLSLVH